MSAPEEIAPRWQNPVESDRDSRESDVDRLIEANRRLQDQVVELLEHERSWESERSQLRAMIDQVPDYVFLKDTQSRFIIANAAVAADLDLLPEDLIGRTDRDIHPAPSLARKYRADERRVMESGHPLIDMPEHVVRPNGSVKHLMTTKVPLRDESGRIIGLVGISRDVSARKLAEEEVRFLAHHDALTRLPNRAVFSDRLEGLIEAAAHEGRQVAVAFLDLDRFKLINDGLGHKAGDELLKVVSSRMRACLGADDTLARIGGDEFVVMFSGGDIDIITATLEQIRRKVGEPLAFGRQTVRVTSSTGVALYPNDGSSAEELLKNADDAMYRAKALGRDCLQFYSETMSVDAQERISLLFSLRSAVVASDFQLVYRPIVDGSRRIVSVEALVRWRDPEFGDVPPETFIPIAEESGLIHPIGDWILRTACQQNAVWRDTGLTAVPVTVAVSSRQLSDAGFVGRVAGILEETGLDPGALRIALTESALLHEAGPTVAALRALQEKGVGLVVVGLGKAFANLANLHERPRTSIWLDDSLIALGSTDGGDMAQIVSSLVSLGRKLGMDVFAEGVGDELATPLDGAGIVPVFGLDRPLAPDGVAELLARNAEDRAAGASLPDADPCPRGSVSETLAKR